MGKINELLKHVQKTNPEMTRKRLIEELGKSRYSVIGLLVAFKNCKSEK